MSLPPPLTLLYVPGDRPDRVAKALASTADAVIVDLEDAVAPGVKNTARANVASLLASVPPERAVQVRVNAAGTPWHDDDVATVAALPAHVGLRLPKAEDPAAVAALVSLVGAREVHLLVESAIGVERAFALASVAGVASLGLGEADLRSELRVDDDAGLTWIRSRVVVAARAAGLPSPVMSVYPHVRDLDGLAESCRAGRRLGFSGRTAIHPGQLDTIRAAFLPSEEEVERAREVVARVEGAVAAGTGALVLADGSFLDVAMVDRARATLALATHHGGR
ncbi:HpcH/HpaI aldolase/citrate lyase family protein [Oceanitalea stevensii]|uniref:CoA ester lyase n=1 Tax=Oceanitalea stevensii TaxID=2763072 RepID=A0ABR8Z3Y5_9MICO|nr:CoA ester lyase [Oceanitalea stevensii]MBD8063020.1 CoA ester lyase [Oceanitalea stevensii]